MKRTYGNHRLTLSEPRKHLHFAIHISARLNLPCLELRRAVLDEHDGLRFELLYGPDRYGNGLPVERSRQLD